MLFYLSQLLTFDKHLQVCVKNRKVSTINHNTTPTIQPTTKSIHIQSLNNNTFYQYDYANIRKDLNR